MYGHLESLAGAIAEGARSVDGVTVTVKRIPESIPPDLAKKHGAKLDQAAPVASPKELVQARFQGRHAATIAKKLVT